MSKVDEFMKLEQARAEAERLHGNESPEHEAACDELDKPWHALTPEEEAEVRRRMREADGR